MERVEVLPGKDPAAAAAALRLDPAVEFAEPNYLIARAQGGPDDARFGEQWALRNTGQAGGAEGSDVRAAAAWQETTGAPSTVVAVIDSGVDFTHPDLANQQWRNPAERDGNNLDDDGNGYADDAQHRRYNRYYSRFEQPDPADSSYDPTDPQSLNRYSVRRVLPPEHAG